MLLRSALVMAGFALHLGHLNTRVYLFWELVELGGPRLEVRLFLDLFRASFAGCVCLIASAVYFFSFNYIAAESHFSRFHLLLLSFVGSILVLILRPNFLMALLGWDGLGLTSFLLVVYYGSTKASNAGILTALTNRIGDALLIVSLALCFRSNGWAYFLWRARLRGAGALAPALLLVAACTKRAQLPFRAWLPAAMAAPTPVSSLVHSSTLVTAGVYLIRRLSSFGVRGGRRLTLLGTALLTITLAGLAALVEQDIKKVVALSTLSQLGVIVISLAVGFPQVAFFHLIRHAFFKALLFICVGNMIHFSSDFQDSRKAGVSGKAAPLTLAFRVGANFSLCGLPFSRGFYSKDLSLELGRTSGLSLIWWLTLFLGTLATTAYTWRFFTLLALHKFNMPPLRVPLEVPRPSMLAIAILFIPGVVGRAFLRWAVLPCATPLILPSGIKILTLVVIFLALIVGPHLSHQGLATRPTLRLGGQLLGVFGFSGSWLSGERLTSAKKRRFLIDLQRVPLLINFRRPALPPSSALGGRLSWFLGSFGLVLALLALVYAGTHYL